MPTYLRRFYITYLTETKTKEADDMKKAQNKAQSKTSTPSKFRNPRLK